MRKAKNWRITKQILQQYGYTPSCAGCAWAQNGWGTQPHSAECRARLEERLAQGDAEGALEDLEAVDRVVLSPDLQALYDLLTRSLN